MNEIHWAVLMLVVYLLLTANSARSEEIQIFFHCNTIEKAEMYAKSGFSKPVAGCTSLEGKGLPEQAATLLEIVKAYVEGDYLYQIGKVNTYSGHTVYSAGRTPPLLF